MAINYFSSVFTSDYKKLWIISIFLVSISGSYVFAQDELTILPLGNSITRGTMCSTGDIFNCNPNGDAEAIGYRNRLYNHMNDAGFNIDFVGNNSYGYSLMSDPDNAGFDGIRDDQLALIMETGTSSHTGQVAPGPYLNSYPADIILLHIGTNDILALDYTVSDVGRILDAIDNHENSTGEPVLVFLARIISRRNASCGTDAGVVQFNNNLGTMAQTRITNGDHIVIVDMECDAQMDYFSDMIDQVHPNQTGYDKMADKWFDAIDNYNSTPDVQVPGQNADRGTAFPQISLDTYVSDVEDTPEEMTWTYLPSSPVYFNISIDANRIVTVTPKNTNWSGSETIEFVATDQGKVITALRKSGSSLTQFTLNWVPEIIGQQQLSTTEDTPLEISITDLVLVEPEKAPGDLELQVLPGNNYTVTNQTVTPALNFFGSLSIPVIVVHNGKESNTYNLVVVVSAVNDPPEIVSSPVTTVNAGDPYVYNVIANDPDPGETLTYSAVEKPSWIQVNGNTGMVSGTPENDDAGFHNIIIRVSDGEEQDDQPFVLEVKYFNWVPVVSDIPNQTVAEGTPFATIILDDYVADADDADTSILWTATSQTKLSVDITDRIAIIIAIDPDWNGSDTIIFQAEDPEGDSDSDQAIFTVTPVNDSPVISDMPDQATLEGQSLLGIDLDGYVADVDDPDSVITWRVAVESNVTIDVVNRIAYITPDDPEWNGSNTLVFTATDTSGASDTDTIIFTVMPVNDPPTLNKPIPDTSAAPNKAFSLVLDPNTFVDIDIGDSLVFSATISKEGSTPGWITFDPASKTFSGTPAESDKGMVEFVVIATDDSLASVSDTFNVEVKLYVGIGNSLSDLEINLYPNPNNGRFVIESHTLELKDVVLEVFNDKGQLVWNRKIINEIGFLHEPLELSGSPAGLYLLKLRTNSDVINKRFIIAY